jgi:integrase
MPGGTEKGAPSLSPEQEARLYRTVLSAAPKRRCAGHCLLIMANTTMGFGELRHLRRRDIVEIDGTLQVHVNEGAKNEFRSRFIPLNAVALQSMQWLLDRWAKLGGSHPDHYLLPHHATRTDDQRQASGHQRHTPPDFTTPVGHMYRAARAILRDAGLIGIVPYDMRSHAITKLLSDPDVSPQVSQEIAGHVDERMQRRYSRQQFDTKRKAVDAMCRTFIPVSTANAAVSMGSQAETPQTLPAATLGEALRDIQEKFRVTPDQLREALSG